jgi:16S rRNA (cytosine1402-N4)-methyltransferase
MLKQIMEYLNPRPGQKFIDCTLGGGGYTRAIALKIKPDGKILTIDLDEMAVENFRITNSDLRFNNVIIAHDNFKNLQAIVKEYFKTGAKFDGIVFDLGLSSAQLENRARGFSFNLAGSPLGMNFGESIEQTAENIINNWSLEDLARIFKEYGEEKFAKKIALAIAKERRINRIITTDQLVRIITGAIPKKFQNAKIHPATKIFQALRLAVNLELENLRQALPQAVNLLKPGAKLAVISYHSLEDRIVKQFFKQEAKGCLCPPVFPICLCGHQAQLKLITRGILRPTEQEVLTNIRSRSAKLRVAEKIYKIHPVK